MTLPLEPEPSPLDLALRHLAHVTGLAVLAEGVPDAASNEARRAQLEHTHFASVYALVSQAESLARIADALNDRGRPDEDDDLPMRGSYGPTCPHGVRLYQLCAACDAEGRYNA